MNKIISLLVVAVSMLLLFGTGCGGDETLEERVTRESQEQFDEISKEVQQRVDGKIKERISEYENKKDLAVSWVQQIYVGSLILDDEKLTEAKKHRYNWITMLDEDKDDRFNLIEVAVDKELFTVDEGKTKIDNVEIDFNSYKNHIESEYDRVDKILESAFHEGRTLQNDELESIISTYQEIFAYTINKLWPNLDLPRPQTNLD